MSGMKISLRILSAKMLSRNKYAIIAILALPVFTQHAKSEDSKSIREVLAEHCIECHRIPGLMEENREPEIGAPDFQEISDNPKLYTRQRLESFLSEPHFPMRRFVLSKSDIQNIITFIDNIRSQPAQP